MAIVVILAIIVLILLIFLYYLEISVLLTYQRQASEDHGEVKFSSLGGLIHYTVEIPTIDMKNLEQGVKVESDSDIAKKDTFITKDKIEHWYDVYESMLYRINHFQASVRWLMARITCERWQWTTVVGTGDAAEAGVITGLVWGVKSNILGFISHYLNWETTPQLDVQPSFQQAVLSTHFEARFSFKLGTVLRFLWKLGLHRRGKQKAGGTDIPFSG